VDDPVAVTVATYDRMAAARLDVETPRPDTGAGRAEVEAFVLRTGRPLPKILVMGGALAVRAMQVDLSGGAALGVDAAAQAVEFARRVYPEGSFRVGDIRDLPVDANSVDGAWTESVIAHIPREEVADALVSLQHAIRPGGLLYVRLPAGDEEGYEETEHGAVYRVRWSSRRFSEVLGAMDFNLLESRELADDELAMTFRLEY
jgi:SAM-dependent methyltransferase